MALNTERSGHRYPAYFYEVGREKVREYAVATFVADAGYGDDAAALSHDLDVPPTFAACITGRVIPAVVDDPELGGHWNLLHTAQSFDFHRPVRVGDVLECTPRIAHIKSRERMELLTLEIACADADSGEPVLTSRGTIVFFTEGG